MTRNAKETKSNKTIEITIEMISERKWEGNALSQLPLIPSNKNKQTRAYNQYISKQPFISPCPSESNRSSTRNILVSLYWCRIKHLTNGKTCKCL